jgi:hypothetical protein
VTFGLLRGNGRQRLIEGRRTLPGVARSVVFRTLLTASKVKASDGAFVSEAPKEPAVGRLSEQPRAQRFTIHTLLRYRATGGEWQEGTMVNISESGVLFQTEQGVPASRDIEMSFSLPTGITGESAAQVACRGVITRTVSPPREPAVVAARFAKFSFVRPGGAAAI